jgi:hypothetical protein
MENCPAIRLSPLSIFAAMSTDHDERDAETLQAAREAFARSLGLLKELKVSTHNH